MPIGFQSLAFSLGQESTTFPKQLIIDVQVQFFLN
jgi:hypothetical protein